MATLSETFGPGLTIRTTFIAVRGWSIGRKCRLTAWFAVESGVVVKPGMVRTELAGGTISATGRLIDVRVCRFRLFTMYRLPDCRFDCEGRSRFRMRLFFRCERRVGNRTIGLSLTSPVC